MKICDGSGNCPIEYDHVNAFSGVGVHEAGSIPENFESGAMSSHGVALNYVGGNVAVAHDIDDELAAAAINDNQAILQINGKSIVADFDEIDADKVELACNEDGCALVLDDGNPHNDLIPYKDSDGYSEEEQKAPPLSSHGIALNTVGGYIENPHTDSRELAAAAVSHDTGVI